VCERWPRERRAGLEVSEEWVLLEVTCGGVVVVVQETKWQQAERRPT
jgi:hypothetical protein